MVSPRVDTFVEQADFKRRNMHLGHLAGDADIEELQRLLTDLGPSVLAARTHGDRWLVLAPSSRRADIESVVARFARQEAFHAGWEVRATKDGRTMESRRVVPSKIARAIRSLFAPVRTRVELEEAVLRIEESDHALPVNRPIAIADVASLGREPWLCVSRYPDESPWCPFCGRHEIEWEEGDSNVYSGTGTCKFCGAHLALTDVSRLSTGGDDDLGFAEAHAAGRAP